MFKKIIIFGLILISALFSTRPAEAYQQNNGVCYSQCAAYKFGWKGDFCWDLFQNQCSISSGDALDKFISLVKDTAQAAITGKLMTIVDITQVFKALFICQPLIDCIVPQLNSCQSVCDSDQFYYAPNLSAGNAYSLAFHNVFYNEQDHTLTFKVINNGLGYAWDIDVSASWGHTRNQDKLVSGGGTLFTEKIPELVFLGARMASPKTPGDIVTDFLIDESNISGWLGRFKSDAKNHYVPPAWYKTIPFTAPSGEFTKVILNVDPNQMIPESSETDNTYILEIDQLPTPASLLIDNLTYQRTDPNRLTEYRVSFSLKNSGEESLNSHVKWYQGGYASGQNPLFIQEMVVQGKNQVNFDQILTVDVSNGGDSCNRSQKFTIVVFDDNNLIKTTQEFYLPLFSGSVTGRVEDLFGKNVKGALITASSGQSATTGDNGYYHLKGIPVLGKITLTVTHPEFSQSATKEVEIKFDDSQDKCRPLGLSHNGINFILQDQDVVFNVIITDQNGNSLSAQVLAANNTWRFNETINGTGALPGMQPGQYLFTLSSPGYKTISQTVNAVPSDQNLEFILEKLNGRPDDNGLNIHEPKLLWQWDRGQEIISQITATKDGQAVMIYTTRNKTDTGKLYFLDSLTGTQRRVVATPATKGQAQACLDTSYDGNTTALYVHDGMTGMSKDSQMILKLFNNQGGEFGTKAWAGGGSAQVCDVSPDGFYIYPNRLMNKGLYVYTRRDIEGVDSNQDVGYSSAGALHWTTANNLIAGCPKGGGQCLQSINKVELSNFGSVNGAIAKIDSSQNGNKIAFVTHQQASLFNAKKLWEKEVKVYGDKADISVTPGGEYVIYTTASPTDHGRVIKIFTANNEDKTPANATNPGKEDVIFVSANDKGIFFLVEAQKTLKYYQVGSYATEYKPATTSPKPEEFVTNKLSYYYQGTWNQLSGMDYTALIPGQIYKADSSVRLSLGTGKTVEILKDTLFSIDHNRQPILLKGQLTAEFNSPVIIYALKFDREEMELFETKLNQFLAGSLAESEYFIIQNVHTKFTIKNNANKLAVAVLSGEVGVKNNELDRTVTANKQIEIDGKNQIKESNYFQIKTYLFIGIAIIIITAVFLFLKQKRLIHQSD